MPHPFSPAGRQRALRRMAEEQVDLLVIGGGITGCGVARDAALRGLSVALIEREDFGYGTSSRSSKLIHSGIRYLAYGDLAMVRESARERYVLRRIAPHLVHPLPFLLPLHAGDSRLFYRTGLFLFDWLAGARGEDAHKLLAPTAVRQRVPYLREALVEGLLFTENITDDARFTLENALSAALHGALVANHARLCRLQMQQGRVVGGEVQDMLTGETCEVRARVVVNAAGPWVGELVRAAGHETPRPLLPSKGVHLLFRASRLPVEGAVALRSPSGRSGFAVRRLEFVYVGTSDEPHVGLLDQPSADRAAVLDVLKLVQDCMPQLGLAEGDIVGTWAGLRPLIAQPGKSARETSRHDAIWSGPPGLLTVAGGKLTTYRPMAARILARVAKELGRALGDNGRTAEVALPHGNLEGESVAAFRQRMAGTLRCRGVSERAAERITWLYGTGVIELLQMAEADADWLLPLASGCAALRGEVKLAVEQGMALRLIDFMDRRAALLLFSEDQGRNAAVPASMLMAQLLGWSEAERREQVKQYLDVVERHGTPRE